MVFRIIYRHCGWVRLQVNFWAVAQITRFFLHTKQFEWAWQQPKESRRLKHITELKRRKPGECYFDYNFRILTEMLRSGPWNRLPLTIRWLDTEFERAFPVNSNTANYYLNPHVTYRISFQETKPPPDHMKICRGHIILRSRPKPTDSLALGARTPSTAFCDICSSILRFSLIAAYVHCDEVYRMGECHRCK